MSNNQILGNSKAELLEWMKGSSKTLGWDALIAVDRATINDVFREHYIELFDGGTPFPEITAGVKINDSAYRYFDRCVLSPPMLSFVDAKITDSRPVCNLSMEISGGREVTLEYYGATQATALKISYITGINPSRLDMQAPVERRQVSGAVGAISVDLDHGVNYAVSSGVSELEVALTGALFKREIAAWPPEDRIWDINQLVSVAGPLTVESFEFRCQQGPGASTKAAENYGDGAVIAFIQTKRGERGTLPTNEEALKYLVPDDDGESYSVTTVINFHSLASCVAYDLFLSAPPEYFSPPYTPLVSELSGFSAFFYDSGVMSYPEFHAPVAGSSNYVRLKDVAWGMGESERPLFLLSSDSVDFDSGDIYNFGCLALGYYLCTDIDYQEFRNNRWHDFRAALEASVSRKFRYSLDTEAQKMKPSLIRENQSNISATDRPAEDEPERAGGQSVLNAAQHVLHLNLAFIADSAVASLPDIALLPLNSLLFSGHKKNYLTEHSRPFDTVLFGHIAPSITAFEITDAMLILGPGRQHPFQINTSTVTVTWSVSNIPGEAGLPTGVINATTGAYVAPAADQIPGSQVRVKVTARSASLHASALVTVVAKELSINPLVQMIRTGNSCDLVARSLYGGSQVWEVDPAKGSLANSPNPDRTKRFTAPDSPAPGTSLDLVEVKVTADGITEKAYVGVIHHNPVITVQAGTIDVAAQKVTLSGLMQGTPVPGITWRKLAGSGEIDAETGIFTAGAFLAEPFVVIQAEAFGGVLTGYLLLPLPLAPYPARPDSVTLLNLTVH